MNGLWTSGRARAQRLIAIAGAAIVSLMPILGMPRDLAALHVGVVVCTTMVVSRGLVHRVTMRRVPVLVRLTLVAMAITAMPVVAATSWIDLVVLLALSAMGCLLMVHPRIAVIITIQVTVLLALLVPCDLLVWPFIERNTPEVGYATSSFWSPAFAAESQHVLETAPRVMDQLGSSTIRGLVDYRGRWINIADGHRVTPGAPSRVTRTLHIFGGSTVVCAEVPDEFTWPAELQRQIASTGTRVINHGVLGATALDRLRALRGTSVAEGDIVVFYVGVNDSRLGLAQQNHPNALFAKWTWGRSVLDRLSHFSNIARAIRPRTQVIYWTASESTVNQRVTRMVSALEMARGSTERRGGRFLGVLQPNLFVSRHWNGVSDGMSDNVRAFYLDAESRLRTIDRLDETSTSYVNGSNFTDDLLLNPFLDWNHVNELGNANIANRVNETLEPLLTAYP